MLKLLTRRGPVTNWKQKWARFAWIPLAGCLLIHTPLPAEGTEGPNHAIFPAGRGDFLPSADFESRDSTAGQRGKPGTNFAGPLWLAQSELSTVNPGSRPSVVVPTPPTGPGGPARQATPSRPATQARPSRQATQAKPYRAPAPTPTYQYQSPAISRPSFVPTPSPRIEIPASPGPSSVKTYTPPTSVLPRTTTKPVVPTPKTVPTEIPTGLKTHTPPAVVLPPSTTKSVKPAPRAVPYEMPTGIKTHTPPAEVLPPSTTKTVAPTPRTVPSDSTPKVEIKSRVDGTAPTDADTSQTPVETAPSTTTGVEQPIMDPNAAAMEHARQEEERARKKAEDQALFNDAQQRRLQSESSVNALLGYESVASITGNRMTSTWAGAQLQGLVGRLSQILTNQTLLMATMNLENLIPPPLIQEDIDKAIDDEEKKRKAAEKAVRDKIEEAKKKAKLKKDAADKEKERRKRDKKYRDRKNREEKLAKKAKALKERQEKIKQRAKDLEQKAKDMERWDKELREAHDKAKRGPPADPNCRGAACQGIRDQRKALSKAKTQLGKDNTQFQKEAVRFNNDVRKFQRDRKELEGLKDRGYGMNKAERKKHSADRKVQMLEEKRANVYQKIEDLKKKAKFREATHGLSDLDKKNLRNEMRALENQLPELVRKRINSELDDLGNKLNSPAEDNPDLTFEKVKQIKKRMARLNERLDKVPLSPLELAKAEAFKAEAEMLGLGEAYGEAFEKNKQYALDKGLGDPRITDFDELKAKMAQTRAIRGLSDAELKQVSASYDKRYAALENIEKGIGGDGVPTDGKNLDKFVKLSNKLDQVNADIKNLPKKKGSGRKDIGRVRLKKDIAREKLLKAQKKLQELGDSKRLFDPGSLGDDSDLRTLDQLKRDHNKTYTGPKAFRRSVIKARGELEKATGEYFELQEQLNDMERPLPQHQKLLDQKKILQKQLSQIAPDASVDLLGQDAGLFNAQLKNGLPRGEDGNVDREAFVKNVQAVGQEQMKLAKLGGERAQVDEKLNNYRKKAQGKPGYLADQIDQLQKRREMIEKHQAQVVNKLGALGIEGKLEGNQFKPEPLTRGGAITWNVARKGLIKKYDQIKENRRKAEEKMKKKLTEGPKLQEPSQSGPGRYEVEIDRSKQKAESIQVAMASLGGLAGSLVGAGVLEQKSPTAKQIGELKARQDQLQKKLAGVEREYEESLPGGSVEKVLLGRKEKIREQLKDTELQIAKLMPKVVPPTPPAKPKKPKIEVKKPKNNDEKKEESPSLLDSLLGTGPTEKEKRAAYEKAAKAKRMDRVREIQGEIQAKLEGIEEKLKKAAKGSAEEKSLQGYKKGLIEEFESNREELARYELTKDKPAQGSGTEKGSKQAPRTYEEMFAENEAGLAKAKPAEQVASLPKVEHKPPKKPLVPDSRPRDPPKDKKKEIKLDPFLFEEVQETQAYQDQVQKKLARIKKQLASAPKNSEERRNLESQQKYYTGESKKNQKKLDRLGEQVASLPPATRRKLERKDPGKGQPVRLMEPVDQEILESYIQWLGESVLPAFNDSPLSKEVLPNLLANLAVQFGPRVAEQIVKGAIANLKKYGLKPDAVLFVDGILEAIAAETRKTRGAEAGRTADLARALFLGSLFNDPQMREGLKLGEEVLEKAQASLDGLVERLRDELGKQLKQGVRNVDKTLETLSSLLLLHTLPVTEPPSVEPLLKDLRRHLNRALDPKRGSRDPENKLLAAESLTGPLQRALQLVAKGPEGSGKGILVERLAGLLADSYKLKGLAARQLEREAMKQYRAEKDKTKRKEIWNQVQDFRKQASQATLGEAVSRLNAGQFAAAWRLVKNLRVQEAPLQLAQANVLVNLVDRVESIYGFLSADERKGLGDLKQLLASRDKALDQLMDGVKDPDKVAALSNRLARNLEAKGQIREAIRILDKGLEKNPNELNLSGARARLLILQQGDKITPASVGEILKGLPEAIRLPAALVALSDLANAGGSPDAVNALAKSLEGADWINRAQRKKLDVEIGRARFAQFDTGYRTPEMDKKLEQFIRETRVKLNILVDVDETYRKAFVDFLEGIREEVKQARWWRQQIKSGIAPAEGFDGIARQALAMGRLDIASEALKKHVSRKLFQARRGDPLRGLKGVGNAIRILDSVRMRMMDPRLLPQQREEFRKFLAETGPQLAGQIDAFIKSRVKSFTRLAGTAEDERELGEQPAQFGHEFRLLGRLRLQAEMASVPTELRDKKFDEVRHKAEGDIQARLEKIRNDFDGLWQTIETDPKLAKSFREARAELKALRGLAAGIGDYEIDTSPGYQKDGKPRVAIEEGFLQAQNPREMAIRAVQHKLAGISIGGTTSDIKLQRSYENGKDYKKGLREKLIEQTGRKGNLERDRLRNKHKDVFKNFWLEYALLKDEVEYYDTRRMELVKEDPERNLQQRNALFEKLLHHEAKTLGKLVGGNKAREFLDQISWFGKDPIRQRVSELEGMILENQRQTVLQEFVEAKKSGDAQRLFRAMVAIREASLAGEIDKFVSYLNVDFDEVGPARAYNLAIGMDATQESLEGVIADTRLLHGALIRAGFNPVYALSDADKKILRKHGYIEGKRYVIPKNIKLTPTKIASEYAAVTQEGVAGAVDSVVNLRQIAELVATVAIPGGIAGRFGRAFTLELLASGLTRSAGGRILAHTAGVVVEGAVFTGLSRGAQTVLNPEMILNPELWTGEALGKEFLHNLAVIGALKLYGTGVGQLEARAAKLAERGAARAVVAGKVAIKTGAFVGEAALLTGLNSALANNQITQESFIENLFLISVLKGTGKLTEGLSAETPGERYAQARIRQKLKEIGKAPRFKPETRVSQMRDAYAKYYEWAGYEVYRNAIETLMTRFGGSWEKARKAYQDGDLPKWKMERLFNLRKKIVDSLTAEIVRELGGDVEAFGSEDPTSDYDVSFKGPKAEVAVILFNARFANRWGLAMEIGGGPSGYRLDTNVYTEGRFKLKGGEKDVWFQDGFAHLAARKHLKDGAWKEYRDWLQNNVDPNKKAELKELLDRVETDHKGFQEAIKDKVRELGKTEKDLNPEQLKMAAENALYEAILKDILALTGKYNKARGKAKAKLAQDIRNLQSRGLYFAQEAYHTEGAIKHVVLSIQAARRSVTPDTLLAKGPPDLAVDITPAEARQSYTEQASSMLKAVSKKGDPVTRSGKAAKYFMRAFDAAKIAGIDLSVFKDIIEITFNVDANRKDNGKVKDILDKKYGEENPDQFLKKIIEAEKELSKLLFGGPRDISVATGITKTGDTGVIALPGAVVERAPTRPIEVAKAPATEPGTKTTGDRPSPRRRTRALEIRQVREQLQNLGWSADDALFAAAIQVVQNNKTVKEAVVISAFQRGYSPDKLKSELGVSDADIRIILDSYLGQNLKMDRADSRNGRIDNYLSGKKRNEIANRDRSTLTEPGTKSTDDRPSPRRRTRALEIRQVREQLQNLGWSADDALFAAAIQVVQNNKTVKEAVVISAFQRGYSPDKLKSELGVSDVDIRIILDSYLGQNLKMDRADSRNGRIDNYLSGKKRNEIANRDRSTFFMDTPEGRKRVRIDMGLKTKETTGETTVDLDPEATVDFDPNAGRSSRSGEETVDAPAPSPEPDIETNMRKSKEGDRNQEEREAREEARFAHAEGGDVIAAEPLYQSYYFEAKTVEEGRKLAVAGNLRARMNPLEKALADSAYEIVQRLQADNPEFGNLSPADAIKYVHLHGGRVDPDHGPAGTPVNRLGGRALSPGEVPASLAAEALLAMGTNVTITPQQLARAAGISVDAARVALSHAQAWGHRFGPAKPGTEPIAETSPR